MTRNIRPVPDYTIACLVMGFVNLMWIFIAIWAAWGLAAVLCVATFLNFVIKRIGQR